MKLTKTFYWVKLPAGNPSKPVSIFFILKPPFVNIQRPYLTSGTSVLRKIICYLYTQIIKPEIVDVVGCVPAVKVIEVYGKSKHITETNVCVCVCVCCICMFLILNKMFDFYLIFYYAFSEHTPSSWQPVHTTDPAGFPYSAARYIYSITTTTTAATTETTDSKTTERNPFSSD